MANPTIGTDHGTPGLKGDHAERSAVAGSPRVDLPAIRALHAALVGNARAAVRTVDVLAEIPALCDELESARADGIALLAAENALVAIAALQPQPEDSASRCVESLIAAVGFARIALTTIGTAAAPKEAFGG